MQEYKFASIQVCKYSSWRVFKYASMHQYDTRCPKTVENCRKWLDMVKSRPKWFSIYEMKIKIVSKLIIK